MLVRYSILDHFGTVIHCNVNPRQNFNTAKLLIVLVFNQHLFAASFLSRSSWDPYFSLEPPHIATYITTNGGQNNNAPLASQPGRIGSRAQFLQRILPSGHRFNAVLQKKKKKKHKHDLITVKSIHCERKWMNLQKNKKEGPRNDVLL